VLGVSFSLSKCQLKFIKIDNFQIDESALPDRMTQAMDIQAMQSMDWLFKKERIYLLAQFWQQVSSN
jgi:hypothetical protein